MKSKQKRKFLIFVVIACVNAQLIFTSCAKESFDNNDPNNTEVKTGLNEVTGYPIVGTNQSVFYNTYTEISKVSMGQDFYGQNANYPGNKPRYDDNQDGTITDLVTGLMWTQSPDLNKDGNITATDKLTYNEAVSMEIEISSGGHDDWRLPTIKELYSLIIFSGVDPSGYNGNAEGLIPFINTASFNFEYGDESAGERIIDAQFATSTIYVGTTMGGNTTMFGVNFADGRIKGYPVGSFGPRGEKEYFILYVRGNSTYGVNDFKDNGDGTITDEATGLMWMQQDNAKGITWEEALNYAEGHEFAGYSDWRLPDAKELQSIVDYKRSPVSDGTPAIDPLFRCSEIAVETGGKDYPFYWSSTTHANTSSVNAGRNAAYVCFGTALGNMHGDWIDVHGAGAQRSDPKAGNPSDYPYGHGPQGDAIRIYNYVRLVRSIN